MFDKVFKPNCTQEDVYRHGAKPIVGGKPYACDLSTILAETVS